MRAQRSIVPAPGPAGIEHTRRHPADPSLERHEKASWEAEGSPEGLRKFQRVNVTLSPQNPSLEEVEPSPNFIEDDDELVKVEPGKGDEASLGKTSRSTNMVQSNQMTSLDVIQCLINHGCDDLTNLICPEKYSSCRVAEGAFGDIWKGELQDGTAVAVKVLRFALVSDSDGKNMKRMAREIYAWSKLDHENVHKLLGITMMEGRLGMVSKWMSQGNLRDYLDRNSSLDRYQLCVQITKGVEYIHSKDMVHGDIKASNILVSADEVLKLTDFDHSLISQSSLMFTATTRVGGGTLRWMAPELFHETSHQSTRPTDIYALGMTFLEVITGAIPYSQCINDAQVILKVMQKVFPVRSLEHLADNPLGNRTWRLLTQCWDHDPVLRPTAQVVLASISMLLSPPMGESAEPLHSDLQSESSRKPDITKAKQFFDHSQSQPIPTPATSTSVPVSSFSPVHSLAAALRSASPGISSNESIVRSPSPVIRSVSPALAPSTASQPSTGSDADTPPTVSAPFSQTPTTQWTVPQVIDWLQSKGFDTEIQRAFQDNDITGDDLIELDGPALKDELGISWFGKRMRLLKHIGELKREDDKAKEQEKQKQNSKEKLVVGSRWSGSSRPTSAIGDDDDRLKIRFAGNRPTSLVLSPSDGALATRSFWDSTRTTKDERGVLSEGESSRKPDITMAKQFFDQPESQPTPTTTTKTDIETDPSEAGWTPIFDLPPSPSFRREETDKEKEKDVQSVTNSEDATSSGHAKKRSIDTGSVTGGARDWLSIFGNVLGKGKKPAPRDSAPAISPVTNADARTLDQIGEPDYSGWMRKKGDRYNSWKLWYFVLKGPHLYYLKNRDTKVEGYVNITGYKVIADENANPGQYGFRIVHDTAKPHFFSSEEQVVVREWMKALMKATILRNYNDPVRSSYNTPTIPLAIAQQMNPIPSPSPTEREAVQRVSRRENPNKLSLRDARILMGLPENGPPPLDPADQRQMRPRISKSASRTSALSAGEQELVEWVNSRLPATCPLAEDLSTSMSSGLILFRLAESIKEVDSGVSDSVFPQGPGDERLDGLFKLFDFLLDNDVRIGAVSINHVRNGDAEKIAQLVRALKNWDEKRRTSGKTKSSVAAGPWMSMSSY